MPPRLPTVCSFICCALPPLHFPWHPRKARSSSLSPLLRRTSSAPKPRLAPAPAKLALLLPIPSAAAPTWATMPPPASPSPFSASSVLLIAPPPAPASGRAWLEFLSLGRSWCKREVSCKARSPAAPASASTPATWTVRTGPYAGAEAPVGRLAAAAAAAGVAPEAGATGRGGAWGSQGEAQSSNALAPSPALPPPPESPQASLVSVCVACPGPKADALVDCLLSLGAASCAIEDASSGAPGDEEEPIFHSGPALWQTQAQGPRTLWPATSVTALFPASWAAADVHLALRMAAQAALLEGWEGLAAQALQGLREVESRDWEQSVREQFKPLLVEEEPPLWVLPPWGPHPQGLDLDLALGAPSGLGPDGSLVLLLEPGLAFGTGEHPTTRLCLRWLRHTLPTLTAPASDSGKGGGGGGGSEGSREGGEGVRVLDFGSGSGILSIAALKLGADSVVGVDIDPLALSAALHNAQLNALDASRFRFLLATPECPCPLPVPAPAQAWASCHAPPLPAHQLQEQQQQRAAEEGGVLQAEAGARTGGGGGGGGGGEAGEGGFSLVVANILLNPLLQLAPTLCHLTKPGGQIALSGILLSQVDAVVEAYRPWVENIRQCEEEGWALLSFTRKQQED